MSTPPGRHPAAGCRCTCSTTRRDPTAVLGGNGGDDAAIVYHEYTHGLSNRLVVDATGLRRARQHRRPAPWARPGATGTRWTSWSQQGFERDTPAPGEVAVGQYVDGGRT